MQLSDSQSPAHKSHLKRIGIVLAAILLLGAGVFVASRYRPLFRVDATTKDLGKVAEGEDLVATFAIYNDGLKPLKVFDVKTDCGCTDLSWQSKLIEPGQSTKLTVHIDTTMKQGAVTKQIRFKSNDSNYSFGALNMLVDVENMHTMMGEGGKAKIFTAEKCAHCHVDNGVGAFGKDLFEADCAMCHRRQAESKILVGPEIEKVEYKDAAQIRHMQEVISFGSKTHRSMPGFLAEAGGPLTKEQVDSIVDYLKLQKK
ncbi:MAG: DUF1573 domain-containing protein [Candidatus Obscuribacter sp.]|jgi:hypothetical protein|nr:DUF1573 domain-containing protein [Candidatus Obscuribacter sp.]MBK9620957.1 DUF1573 domain-containing protein [Candidatus Obscuribacter sp.]MBK9771412.1 DUF1573 domain-containing protein [Candidatus Obscuribacter sp.]MDQ5964638.1 hypothetical protein [Cyanobacteriota bacterium erpe_2018_sw_39hr_WHONDRS-SW48-000098_B_bin.30]